ncbi:MAG: flagellar hook-length control protein FliK, partial [Candidatus Sumerlaeota bacterium]
QGTLTAGATETGDGVESVLEEFLNTGGAVVGALNFLNASPELVDILADNGCKVCQYLQPRMGEGGNSQLGAIVQQLQNLLNQLSGNGNTSAAPDADLSLAGIAMEGLRQVLDDQAPQGIKADPRAIPELIYIGDAKGSGARLLSTAGVEGAEPLEAGSFQLFQGPEDASSRPIQALQVLLERVRQIDSGQSKGLTDSMSESDRMLMDFLGGRLDPTGARGMEDLAGAMVQTEVREAAMSETVRQVQAMMADMAGRMQGQVLMDTENMRAVMHLEPPILGRVHVTLQIQDGQMVAHIASDQSATQDFLQENESELRQGLANEEYDPEDIEIVFDDDIQRAFGLELRKMVV